ncbi:aspartic peptidase domain-containing protein [Dunaliella salina]|uniref:Aspartic peptidase domain-containing protein n=1 Tax=Dunaliella salina TaxID=3046 RepID=A0ABQ7GN35_DUNSA|nr:aspartic peptidase domain-containing protein [Dunaliella salina]|eukprot:KAF5836020.1 aspartic peptidase domain-containing protein [Dunaliella salina]
MGGTLAHLLVALAALCDLHPPALAWTQLFSSTAGAFATTNASAPVSQDGARRLLEQAFPGAAAVQGGVALPIAARHNVARSRGLLRSGVLPVDGSVNEVGYYYATVNFGTPARHFDLIVDTGSTITYVPCSDCGSNCGKHEDAAFDPKKSSTARVLGCAPQEPKCNCGSPRCTCRSNKCYFTRSYAEGSSSQGVLVEDVFAFPDTAGSMAGGSNVRIVFGCEEGETGEIYRQKADGLIGMGDNDNSFHSQLLNMGAIADSFALCFGYPSGGTMLLGDVSFPGSEDMVYTPLLKRSSVHYYTLILNEITVGNKLVEVPSSTYARGYGCVLDSGTTFLYLPSSAFNLFSKLVKDAAQQSKLPSRSGPDPRYKDICWRNAPLDPKQLHTVFPIVDLIFAGRLKAFQPYFSCAACHQLSIF